MPHPGHPPFSPCRMLVGCWQSRRGESLVWLCQRGCWRGAVFTGRVKFSSKPGLYLGTCRGLWLQALLGRSQAALTTVGRCLWPAA